MSFSMTILAYSILEYGSQLSAAGQLNYALTALQWGTDYFLKAHTAPDTLWGQVALYQQGTIPATSTTTSMTAITFTTFTTLTTTPYTTSTTTKLVPMSSNAHVSATSH